MTATTQLLATKSCGSNQLLSFIQYLRGKKIPVSPADTLLAIEVVALVGYQNKSLLRDGLAAALAKSVQELQDFEEAFEYYFQTENKQRSEVAPITEGGSESVTGSRLSLNLQPHIIDGDPLSQLRDNPLFKILKEGDKGALAISIEKAAATTKVDKIKLFTQRGQYMRKILDALGENALREAAIEYEQSAPGAFSTIQALREQLREHVRDRIERAYLIHASTATEDLMDEALSKIKLGNIDPNQMNRLKRLINRMARKLVARHGRRRKKAKRGTLHIGETMRYAISTDGVPFSPKWRINKRRRPQIMAICDVSGSVSAYAKFLLMFLYAIQDILPRTRSFAFSAALGEVSDLFATMPVEAAIERVNIKYGGATDYGRALENLSGLALSEINRSTTVIILGDARNNQANFPFDILAEIKARSQKLIWLNPESNRLWGTGDSEMLQVARHCHIAKECNNLKQLERIIDKLLSERH